MMRFEICTNYEDFGWVFAEFEPGKRVTEKMVTFQTKLRYNVRVNPHGVVLFESVNTARKLLEKDFPQTV